MTPLFLYLLKVNIALLLFYLAYRYGLRRLTFYTLNRFFLLFAIAFSSVYPLIDINGFLRDHRVAGGEMIYYLPDLGNLAQESSLGIWNVLTVVFWSGVALMAARFLVQFISLARIHFTSEKRQAERQTVRIVTEKINPFSFFRNIYINPLLHSPEEQDSILEHEQVHVKEWHTADILAGELNRIFYWFNPGAWLMMTAIRENLEFITDRKVLQNGIDAKTYQYSLVKVSKIPYASSLANNFNFSHLKIRITMMDKKPSSELHLVKYLVLLPFVAATALAFNVSRAELNESMAGVVKITELMLPMSDTLPDKAPEFSEKMYNNNSTVYYNYSAHLKGIPSGEPPVNIEALKDILPSETIILNGKKARFSEVVIEEVRMAAKLKNELASYYIPGKGELFWIETKGAATIKNRPNFPPPPPVVKEVRFTPPKVIKEKGNTPPPPPDFKKPETDKSQWGKSKSAGEKNKGTSLQSGNDQVISYGVIKSRDSLYALFFNPENSTTINKVTKSGDTIPIRIKGSSLDLKISGKSPLYIIDDQEADGQMLKTLPPGDIHSIEVIKDERAIKEHGEKGKNGVIIITTKKQANAENRRDQLFLKKAQKHLAEAQDSLDTSQEVIRREIIKDQIDMKDALVIVDGKVSPDGLNAKSKNLDPNNIKSISILKDQGAIAIYGKKGEKGVIIITTKDGEK